MSSRAHTLSPLTYAMYPELRPLRPEERSRLLCEARRTPFDTLELIGMAAALVLVTALTRYGVAGLEPAERFAAVLLNFLIAMPLLAVTMAPFLLRRTRRGLRARLEGQARG